MTSKRLTIPEAVRALTVGDCSTRREAVKTIREYFENGDPVERIREEISDFEEEVFQRTKDYLDYAAVRHCLEIIDKYREPQG